jgi:hypothetical protein
MKRILIFCASLILVTTSYGQKRVSGQVLHSYTKEPIEGALIEVEGKSTVRIVTNSEGEFTIPLTDKGKSFMLRIGGMGFNQSIHNYGINDKTQNLTFYLEPREIRLKGINVEGYRDPQQLIEKMLSRRKEYEDKNSRQALGFFRERIQKRGKNLSLAEAVISVVKRSNTSDLNDLVFLNQLRKANNYRSIDSVAVKLQGGPFNILYTDLAKYPEIIFDATNLEYYKYVYLGTLDYNKQEVLQIAFEPRNDSKTPKFSGVLYLNKATFDLVRADLDLDVSNREKASKIFVKKKPEGMDIWPTMMHYQIDYAPKKDRWLLQYGKIDLEFRVNWRSRLFRRTYQIEAEMAVTDWFDERNKDLIDEKARVRPNKVLIESIEGFYDPIFWENYTIIEPDSEIEKIITKIERQLKRLK